MTTPAEDQRRSRDLEMMLHPDRWPHPYLPLIRGEETALFSQNFTTDTDAPYVIIYGANLFNPLSIRTAHFDFVDDPGELLSAGWEVD